MFSISLTSDIQRFNEFIKQLKCVILIHVIHDLVDLSAELAVLLKIYDFADLMLCA